MIVAGIAFGLAFVSIAVIVTLLRNWSWEKKRPRFEHNGVRFTYKGTPAWPDLERAIDAAVHAAPNACEGLWVFITGGLVITSTIPDGKLPDGSFARGGTDAWKKWPWSKPQWVVVLAKDGSMATAASSALWSEVCDCVSPGKRGLPWRGQEGHQSPLALELNRAAKDFYLRHAPKPGA